MTTHRILIAGSRYLVNEQQIKTVLTQYHPYRTVLINGNAKGADAIAKKWAIKMGMKVLLFPAQWKKYGKAAGPIRNKRMLEAGKPTKVFIFLINGIKCAGSVHMRDICEKAGIPTTVFELSTDAAGLTMTSQGPKPLVLKHPTVEFDVEASSGGPGVPGPPAIIGIGSEVSYMEPGLYVSSDVWHEPVKFIVEFSYYNIERGSVCLVYPGIGKIVDDGHGQLFLDGLSSKPVGEISYKAGIAKISLPGIEAAYKYLSGGSNAHS